MREAGLLPAETKPEPPSKKKDSIYEPSSARNSTTSFTKLKEDTGEKDEFEEALRHRLEGIGLHVGANFSER